MGARGLGLLTIGVVLPAGCLATFEQLQARAAFDLDCPPASISARELDDRTQIATGCGKQAVYVQTCTNRNSGCTWMLNSEVKPMEARAP